MKRFFIVILMLVISSSIGCIGEGYNNIGEINNNPENFANEQIKIKGEVIEKYSVPIVNIGAYKLDDGSGSIWVITSSGVPGVGTDIKVDGNIATSFELGALNFGTVINENQRSEMSFIETIF